MSDGLLMIRGPVTRGGTIFNQGNVIVEHKTDRKCLEHTHSGADAGRYQAVHSARAEDLIQIRADKRTVAVLGNDQVALDRFKARIKLSSPCAFRAGEGFWVFKFGPYRRVRPIVGKRSDEANRKVLLARV